LNPIKNDWWGGVDQWAEKSDKGRIEARESGSREDSFRRRKDHGRLIVQGIVKDGNHPEGDFYGWDQGVCSAV
jgi:hypothetical protein